MIDLYCGVNEQDWNGQPVRPGPLACIAPVYGKSERTKRENRITVPSSSRIIQDSGAFSDSLKLRLSFDMALLPAERHAERYGYADQIELQASYDLLIDEKWQGGTRHKERWSETDAEAAVTTTVEAARYIDQHRNGISLIQSAQGVSAAQYLDCTRRLMPYLREGDVLGLGGWCIIGKHPRVMLPVFRQTIQKVIPYAASQGVKRIHIWGVVYYKALGELLWLCDQHGIALSTDSAGPQLRPCFGEWGYAEWRNNRYVRLDPKYRGVERALHVEWTRQWLANFRETKHYHAPRRVETQLALF